MALARPRSASPTRVLWENRQAAQRVARDMARRGLHVFDPTWTPYHSASFTECILKVYGSDETVTLPVQVCTKVRDVKNVIAYQAQVNPDDLVFVVKQGCTWIVQSDNAEVARKVTVRGLRGFKPQKMRWPHPIVMLGTGYGGIKAALLYREEEDNNFLMFDRYDRVGGHAWITQANKTSKLQTELSAFHVWFGVQWGEGNERLSYPTQWGTWPKKDEVIAHMQHAAERYGILPHCTFRVNGASMDIVGHEKDFNRHYSINFQRLDSDEEFQVATSAFWQFPGAYFTARRIEYPGEDQFDGHLGYGMNDDIPFDTLEGSRAAILGNGAFAVENIRTCCEYGVEKVYLVTRRKNLPSPRLPCWFVHQSIIPVPASMVLNSFGPMFQNCGFGDPWEYHSVYASKDRSKCTISSASRFGIGDVTFLAVAWGRCEFVVDVVKRFTQHCLHTERGVKLEGVTVVIKCLGLIADFGADRLHKVREFVGPWPSGDFRRIISADALGMHAANFTTFSAGIAGYGESVKCKFLLDFPQEFQRLVSTGVVEMLPRSKATDTKPAHQMDSQYAQTSAMIIEGNLPRLSQKMVGLDDYMSAMYHAVNPTEKFFVECKASWDQYQEDWWKMGFEHEYVPYPYTEETVHEWFDDYAKTVGPISVAAKKEWEEAMKEYNEKSDQPAQWDGEGSKFWWMASCSDTKDWWAKRRFEGAG